MPSSHRNRLHDKHDTVLPGVCVSVSVCVCVRHILRARNERYLTINSTHLQYIKNVTT